jgi:hypothetical protein
MVGGPSGTVPSMVTWDGWMTMFGLVIPPVGRLIARYNFGSPVAGSVPCMTLVVPGLVSAPTSGTL